MKKGIVVSFFALLLQIGFAQQKESLVVLKEANSAQIKIKDCSIAFVKEGLLVTVPPGKKGALSFFPKTTYWDLTKHKYISFELENQGDVQVRFQPQIIYDNPKVYGKKKKNFAHNHIGFVNAKERLQYNCVFIRDKKTAGDYAHAKDFPGMKGIPGGLILNFSGIDAKRVRAFKIFFPTAESERKILLSAVFKNQQLVPQKYLENPTEFFPFINKYGQYKHGTWPGKITDDSQFALAKEKEAKDLAKFKGSDEWNEFGGFKNGPQLKATGFFRTEKIDEKWWIVDPNGRLFWSTGINGAGKLSGKVPLKGRTHFFEDLPAKNSTKGKQFYAGNNYDFSKENLYRKYGKNSELKYTEVSLERMKSWGFNTLGGWCTSDFSGISTAKKLPYTLIVSEVYPGINEKFPDVFNPKWKDNLEKKIQARATGKVNDPYLFGIFINNEIDWGTHFSLATNTMAKNEKCFGKQAYVKLLQKHFNSIEDFNKLLQSNFKSWDELLKTKVGKKQLNLTKLKKINMEHYKIMCEKYFEISSKLVKKHLPNTMYIGCRWHGHHKNDINTTISAKYLDILSFNAYENEVEFYPHPIKEIDKPFIISEFNFGALDRGKFFTGLGYASSQRNRGEKYVNFVKGAMRNPRCVGTHWFMWANSSTAGKSNGENANCGVVSITDQIYYELIGYMRGLNYKIYDYRITNKEK